MSEPTSEDLYRSYRAVEADQAGDGTEGLFVERYLVECLGPYRAEPILEIGAGTGMTLRVLAAAGFSKVEGVDSSASQVAVAARLGSDVALGDGVEALAARPSGSLGAILALDVLEHLPLVDLLRLMELAADRLRPGGLLVARVPNGEGLFGGAILHGDLTHLRAFTARSLTQAFALRGLEPVFVRPVRPMAHGAVSWLRAALWMAVEGLAKVASAAETGRVDVIVTRNVLAAARRPA